MSDPLFDIDVQRGDGTTRVIPRGEVDIATAPTLEDALQGAQGPDGGELVIDLRGVTFMDSTGLRTLVTASEAARIDGRRLAIISGAGVARILAVSGLQDILPLVDDA